MNKNNIFYVTVILLASLTLGACGSDDEQKAEGYTVATVSQAPTWQIDWQGNDTRPDWQEPDIQNYENWSIIKVQIEDALIPYTSTDDLMAVFVAGECRAVQGPALVLGSPEQNTTTYLLKAWGNENDGERLVVTLKYYNAQLKQVFARTATMTYRIGRDIGVGTDFIPQLTFGSSKYPVVQTFDATGLMAKASITPAVGDLIAAFVGDECRGVNNGESDHGQLTIFGRSEGESVTIRYYQAANGNIYTFPDVVKTENQQLTNSPTLQLSNSPTHQLTNSPTH